MQLLDSKGEPANPDEGVEKVTPRDGNSSNLHPHLNHRLTTARMNFALRLQPPADDAAAGIYTGIYKCLFRIGMCVIRFVNV